MIVALVLCFAPQIMRVYSSDDYIVRVGGEYLRTVAFSYVAVGILNSLYAACRSVEKVQIILCNNLVTHAINLLLNYGLPVLVPGNDLYNRCAPRRRRR